MIHATEGQHKSSPRDRGVRASSSLVTALDCGRRDGLGGQRSLVEFRRQR